MARAKVERWDEAEQYELYDGRVRLYFDVADHRYGVLDANTGLPRVVPSVTSILGVLGKPWLVPWAAKMVATSMQGLLKPATEYTSEQIEELCLKAKKAPTEKKDWAADIGTIVHGWIERHLRDGVSEMPPQPEAQKGIGAFLEWRRHSECVPLEVEQKIFSISGDYAGTFDGVFDIHGRRMLVDFKTSESLHDDYWLQLAGYELARSEEGKPKSDGWMLVNVRKDGELVVETMDDPQAMAEQLDGWDAALMLYRWQQSIKRRGKE